MDSPVNHVKVQFLRSGSFGKSLENSETIQQMHQLCQHLHIIQKKQANKIIGMKTCVPLDADLLLHLLPEAILSQQLMVQRKREGILEHQWRPTRTIQICRKLYILIHVNWKDFCCGILKQAEIWFWFWEETPLLCHSSIKDSNTSRMQLFSISQHKPWLLMIILVNSHYSFANKKNFMLKSTTHHLQIQLLTLLFLNGKLSIGMTPTNTIFL